ncbi:MFS transporter [Candidatus Peregrinibacteria bacterium]|nr:MFS transporter [Candidatus Peregrinibacteria bacterium]
MNKSFTHKIHFKRSPIWVIFEVTFFRSLAAALLTSILPIYFKQFVGTDAKVGLVFLVGYFAAFLSNLYAAHIIEHLRKRKSLLLALIIFTVSFASYTVIKHTPILLIVFGTYQFILALFVLDVSLYIKHYSNYKEIAENAGKLGSFSNIGWMIGPLLGSLIADKFGFNVLFLTSSVVSLIALIIFFTVHLSGEEVHFPHSKPFAKNLKLFFKDANLCRTYINNAGLGFIFSIWDFLPLLMLQIGATIPIIGMTKTLMGVPQSIFEFPIGRMADKETGERKIFMVGYILAAVFTLALGFTTDLHYFITFFFIAATGTSFLEMTRDSYFFRQMSEKDIELVSVYRTSDTLPYLLGQVLAIAMLAIFPIKWWFIIGGLIAILIFVPNAYKLRELRRKQA